MVLIVRAFSDPLCIAGFLALGLEAILPENGVFGNYSVKSPDIDVKSNISITLLGTMISAWRTSYARKLYWIQTEKQPGDLIRL
jgi:hypothetical protein